MAKETSRANIRKAQDTRRLIGVTRFLERLQDYQTNPGLWDRVVKEFKVHGFTLRKVKE